MRIVLQRVSAASVKIDGVVKDQIGPGMLVFLGVEEGDTEADAEWLVGKISQLRIFDDEHGQMNLPVTEVNGKVLVVSQFTLHASTRKGNRPSYIRAAKPEEAIPLYEFFIKKLEDRLPDKIRSGVFGADMKVSLVNDGPVTIIIDSRLKE